MTHDQATVLLLDLAYGELAPDVADEVARHATDCAECTRELASIAAVRGAAARLDDRPPSPASREELLRAARRAASSRRHRSWVRRPATLSFAAAAAVVAIVAGVTLKLTKDDLGSARDGPRGVVENATPGSPEPSTEERRGAPPQPAAPPPAFARPPAPTVPRGPPAQASRLQKEDANLALPSPSIPSADAAMPSRRSVGGPAPGGGLVEERRQLQCGDVLVERVALVAPGGRIVKLTERRGEVVAEGWYDDRGRLRDAGRPEQAATGAPGVGLPHIAPTLEALGTACAW